MSQPPAEPPAGPPGRPSDRPAGVLGAVRRVARRIDSWLSKPSRAVLLGADDLVVRAPLEDEVWPAGSEQVVAWFVTGPVGPVDIHLVQREGVSTVTRAVLAEELPSHRTSVRVTVPPGTPAGAYLILVTNQNMLDAYSRPFRVTATAPPPVP